jgi:hypothetical protein
VIKLLADANIQGQVARLAERMQAEPWKDFWDYLELRLIHFDDVGLALTDSDAVVWRRCQENELLLLTDNRNDDGPESLAATIRANNRPHALPVFTIADCRRVHASKEYADRVIDRLLRYLLELDSLRGAGRLYLP